MLFAAIVITWIVIPGYLMTLGFLSTNIVDDTCEPWSDYSRIPQKALFILEFLITYLLPLMTMLICYSRIVYSLTHKVTTML